MWEIFIKLILFFFGYEFEDEEKSIVIPEEKENSLTNTNNQQFFLNKKKIIIIILILIFLSGWGYFYSFQIPDIFINTFYKTDLWTELKNCTDSETFNKIYKHVQNIQENPYYRQRELTCLRFIQWTNLLQNTENSEELKKCIEKLINQIEEKFKNEPKYTSYK